MLELKSPGLKTFLLASMPMLAEATPLFWTSMQQGPPGSKANVRCCSSGEPCSLVKRWDASTGCPGGQGAGKLLLRGPASKTSTRPQLGKVGSKGL